jgi:hypothetical protein
MNKLQIWEQIGRAIQMFAQTVNDEKAMEIATIYPSYEVGKLYKANDMFTYGVNGVGDPQLYRVNQDRTSQADWIPRNTPSLYKAIGIVNGYVEWSQPSGAHDTYNKGDIVWYQEKLYISTVDGNAYAPGVVDGQWIIYEG